MLDKGIDIFLVETGAEFIVGDETSVIKKLLSSYKRRELSTWHSDFIIEDGKLGDRH